MGQNKYINNKLGIWDRRSILITYQIYGTEEVYLQHTRYMRQKKYINNILGIWDRRSILITYQVYGTEEVY